MGRLATPPDEITLVYRPVGQSHVFTAAEPEMSGFHISSPYLEVAFGLASIGLGGYVSKLYGIEAEYEIQCSFKEFEDHLKGKSTLANFVIAKMAQHERVTTKVHA
ncbi:MAG: hypothetical protein HYX37_04220 [Rhizobiales bacterium]|nr:hypothetical protein [Hyphomicrobiales bacterium]